MLKSKLVVRDTDTLEEALVAIENNSYRSVIVLNETDVVVGTLSDGDARKSVLDHRLLSTPVHRVMNWMQRWVPRSTVLSIAARKMRKRGV